MENLGVENILTKLYHNYLDGGEWDKAKIKLNNLIKDEVIKELKNLYNKAEGSGRNITNIELLQAINKLKQE